MDNKVQIPSDIRQFLESILQEAGMLTLDEKSREDIIDELFFQLDNYLASVIVKQLEPEDLETFIKMNEEKKSKKEIEQFVREKLPQAQEVFENAFIDFKNMYLGGVTTERERQSQSD